MRWFLYLVAAGFVALILAVATLGTVVVLAWPRLPDLEALTDYRPRIPLRVFSSSGRSGATKQHVQGLRMVPSEPPNLHAFVHAAG